MARLILKAPYYKPGHRTESGKSRGGYAEYIATREGVEILRGGMLGYIGERQGSNGLFSDEGEKKIYLPSAVRSTSIPEMFGVLLFLSSVRMRNGSDIILRSNG